MFSFFRSFLFRQIDYYNDRNQPFPAWLRFFIKRDKALNEYWLDLKDLESFLIFQRDDYLISETVNKENKKTLLTSEQKKSIFETALLQKSLNVQSFDNHSRHFSSAESVRRNDFFKWLSTAVSFLLLIGIASFFLYYSKSEFPMQSSLPTPSTISQTKSPQVSPVFHYNEISSEQIEKYFPLFLLSPVETTYYLMKRETTASTTDASTAYNDIAPNIHKDLPPNDNVEETLSEESTDRSLNETSEENQSGNFYSTVVNKVLESNSISSYIVQVYKFQNQ